MYQGTIQCSLVDQLKDLDFADDMALPAHTQIQWQAKTTKLEVISFKLVTVTTKAIRINSNAREQSQSIISA